MTKKNGVTMTRNEARKFNDAIRKTKTGKYFAELGNIIGNFGLGGPFSGNPWEQALQSNVPAKWLNHGPAWLENVHDRGENGSKNMRYLGQPVVIEEIIDNEVFGIMYKCRYVGEDHLDGEYVNNTMFSGYHLRQLPEIFTEFKTEAEAREHMDTFEKDWTVMGTRQIDDDGAEVWAVGAWIEPDNKG